MKHGSSLPLPVTDRQLEVGIPYAIRPETGMQLEPAIFIGRTLYEFAPADPRNYRRPAYARLGKDGWWRPTWAGGPPKMRWDEYIALPEAERPLSPAAGAGVPGAQAPDHPHPQAALGLGAADAGSHRQRPPGAAGG